MNGFQRRLTWGWFLVRAVFVGVISPAGAVRVYRSSDFRVPPDEAVQR